MFLMRMPGHFIPESYGWERTGDFVGPHQQHPGFGCWRRRRPPHSGYEALTICVHDEESGALGGWFHPRPSPESASLAELWRLLSDDPRTPGTATG